MNPVYKHKKKIFTIFSFTVSAFSAVLQKYKTDPTKKSPTLKLSVVFDTTLSCIVLFVTCFVLLKSEMDFGWLIYPVSYMIPQERNHNGHTNSLDKYIPTCCQLFSWVPIFVN